MTGPTPPRPPAQPRSNIRERLAALHESSHSSQDSSPERSREILEERARALARPALPPVTAADLEVLTFRIAEETFAIETRWVLEVFYPDDVVPLPAVEPPAWGLSVWRGELLPLIDLLAQLKISGPSPMDSSMILVAGEADAAFGIPLTEVVGIKRLPSGSLSSAVESGALLRGLTADAVLVLEGRELIRTFS